MKDSLNNETPVQYSTWKEFGYWLIQIVKKNDKRTDDIEDVEDDHEKRLIVLEECKKNNPSTTDLDKRLSKLEIGIKTVWFVITVAASFIAGSITLIVLLLEHIRKIKI